MIQPLRAPFPYFGGKKDVADYVWSRLGTPKQYVEPFCGSAAMLLAAPKAASLEVIGDANGFIANFWRAVKHQPRAAAEWADYPVSHVDLGARHRWLMDQRGRLEAELQDPDWPGCAKVAGWWLWGQCAWIGSGWCDWSREKPLPDGDGQIPHVSNAGRGIQASGKIPHVSDAGRGMLTTGGAVALRWLGKLSSRLNRVRVVHGSWDRCLNVHYGTNQGGIAAVFIDPPYRKFEGLYGVAESVADGVEAWSREHADLRVALCGHLGDYDLPGWDAWQWSRKGLTYSGGTTTDQECIWFSPACLKPVEVTQLDMFAEAP